LLEPSQACQLVRTSHLAGAEKTWESGGFSAMGALARLSQSYAGRCSAIVAFDLLLKKYFALVILALVALVAYFQASGVTQLLGAAIGGTSSSAAPPGPPAANRGRATADAIISRNPFDSVTGPLTPGASIDIPVPTASPVDKSD